MAKKKKSKPESKPKGRKPSHRALSGSAINYANTVRFLLAGATDAGWRSEVGSGDEQRVRAALASIGINLPDVHLELLIQTCLQIAALPGNGWNLFDDLRTHLQGAGGTGAA